MLLGIKNEYYFNNIFDFIENAPKEIGKQIIAAIEEYYEKNYDNLKDDDETILAIDSDVDAICEIMDKVEGSFVVEFDDSDIDNPIVVREM